MKKKKAVPEGAEEEVKTAEKPSYNPLKDAYDWMHCIIVAMIVCVLLFVLVARVIDVRGQSMEPTLVEGDKIIITRLAGDYQQGDIIVLRKDSFRAEPIVKRVIALEGQTVEIDFEEGIVYVDGVALDEPYTRERTYKSYDFETYEQPLVVPENCVFVMGDNRNNSSDSRVASIGCVDEGYIMGKAVFRLFPLDKMGAIYGSNG